MCVLSIEKQNTSTLHAADHSEALDKQAAQRRRLNDSSNSLTASHEAKPLEVEEVEDEELTLLNLASSTAATHSGINGIQVGIAVLVQSPRGHLQCLLIAKSDQSSCCNLYWLTYGTSALQVA